MWWLDFVFFCIGATVVAALAGIALFVAAVLLWALLPRLHVGRPKNDGELCFYDPRVIISGKDGKPIKGERRMIAAPLKIRWWLALSKRNSSRWFIGVMRFDEGE